MPQGEIYEVFWEDMRRWGMETRNAPHQDYCITSFDGLKLYGKYYEFAPNAPVELMFHGYRGSAERDLSGGMQRCFAVGHSAFIVEQRCSGRSEGNVITFGIREHRDCLSWVRFLEKEFGPDVKIILTGISMGAATVMMAAGKDLPSTVIGVLADCGYNSPKDIMVTVASSMGLPGKLLYPIVRFGAILFGGFDPEEYSPEQALVNCKVPVIFFHGEDDAYVPSYMSRRNYDICKSRKKLIMIPGAGHGLAYPVEQALYLKEVKEFFEQGDAC